MKPLPCIPQRCVYCQRENCRCARRSAVILLTCAACTAVVYGVLFIWAKVNGL